MLLDFRPFFLTPQPPQLLVEANRDRTLVTGRGAGAITPDFDPIQPGEGDVFTFDISRELATDESVTSAAWDCVVASTLPGFTVDPSPSSRISGISKTTTKTYPSGRIGTFTNQMLAGMVLGNYYYLRATINIGPAGRTIKRYSRVLCQDEVLAP